MKLFFAVVLLSLQIANANVAQKLPNGQWSYYGENFYQTPVSKQTLTQILNGNHATSPGKLDVIGGNCTGTCYQHSAVGYDKARDYLFGQIYLLKNDEGTYVKDVYCGKEFHFRQVSEAGGMHASVNIEHTWPQSKFSTRYQKMTQKSDLHHLFLTDSEANSQRGNNDFGDLTNVADELHVQDCTSSKLGRLNGSEVFMPPVAHRGNVARALFYFATHYELQIPKTEEDTLRQWHKADPVDESERTRHELIASLQKSRNPFVDYPELVDRISDF